MFAAVVNLCALVVEGINQPNPEPKLIFFCLSFVLFCFVFFGALNGGRRTLQATRKGIPVRFFGRHQK